MSPKEVRIGSERPAKGRLGMFLRVVGNGRWQILGGSHASHDLKMPSVAAGVEHLALREDSTS